jgi:hypothetical protein
VVAPGVAGEIENTAVVGAVEIDSVPENDAAAVRTTVEPPPAVEVCGNCLDDDGNLLTDFEDPACCGSAAGLIAKRLRIVPRKGRHALALAGQLPAGAGNPPAEDLVLQLRQSNTGEVLCARLPAAKFVRRRRSFVFADKKSTVGTARGLTRAVLSPKRNGSARLLMKGRRMTLAGPAAGPVRLTVGFHAAGSAAGRCVAGDATLTASRKGALRYP